MLTPDNKILAFEYLSHQFINWFRDINSDQNVNVENEFSKLKLIKLLFFASAVSSESHDNDLLNDFDNYYAMPYGHVESDVYNRLGELSSIKLLKNRIEIISDNIPEIQPDLKAKLDASIQLLKQKNQELVLYDALDLVELSHTYESWISIYNMARSMNKFSMKIPNDLIRRELKYFNLN